MARRFQKARKGGGPRGPAAKPGGRQPGNLDRFGQIRRSHAVSVYGPGSIIDLRDKASGSPISGVMAGLDEWDAAAAMPGLLHRQAVHEFRLEQALGVFGFRLPPIRMEHQDDTFDVLPVIRYPRWLQCPVCGRLDESEGDWGREPGYPARKCTDPGCGTPNDPVYAVPVRFIVACPAGHLDDFPWKIWCGCTCSLSKVPTLYLDTRGAGLAGKVIRCADCKKECSLDGAYGADALERRNLSCRGLSPWLGPAATVADCSEVPRVLQRGASNVYWSQMVSSLDIKPFASDPGRVLSWYWDRLQDKDLPTCRRVITDLGIDKVVGRTVDELIALIGEFRDVQNLPQDAPLQWPEYRQFVEASRNGVFEKQFQAQSAGVPPEFKAWIESVVAAERLREVRALLGFTRIFPPSGPFRRGSGQELCSLSHAKKNWLPAIEQWGEGIFVRLPLDKVKAWESRQPVIARVAELRASVQEDLREEELAPEVSARHLLVHSLAHALVRQLSLDSGYSSSALRERVYVGEAPYEMVGVLIYTGSPDSEGTLGGLVRQALPDRFESTLRGALESMVWCSSDPLCITTAVTLSSPRNAAACHACLLVPETACEHFNSLLDRALLIGTPEDASIGFFADYLSMVTTP